MENNLALLSIAPKDFDAWRSLPQEDGYASIPMPQTDAALFHQNYVDHCVNTNYATAKWCGRKVYYLLAIPFKVVEMVISVAGAVLLLIAAIVSRILNGDWQIAPLAGRQLIFSIQNFIEVFGFLFAIVFDEAGMLFLEERKLWFKWFNLNVDDVAKSYFSHEKIVARYLNYESSFDNSKYLAAYIERRFNETHDDRSKYLPFRTSLKNIIESSENVIELFKVISLFESHDFKEVLFTWSFDHLLKTIFPKIKEKDGFKTVLDNFKTLWDLINKMNITSFERVQYWKECLECIKNLVNIKERSEIVDFFLTCSGVVRYYDDEDECSKIYVGHIIKFLTSPESAAYGDSFLLDSICEINTLSSRSFKPVLQCCLELIKCMTSPLFKNTERLKYTLLKAEQHSGLLGNFIKEIVDSTHEYPDEGYCYFIFEFFSEHKKLCKKFIECWHHRVKLFEENKEIFDPNVDKQQLNVLKDSINAVNWRYGKFFSEVLSRNPRILDVYLTYFLDVSTKFCVKVMKMFALNYFESFNKRVIDYLWAEKAEATCNHIIEKACAHEKDEQLLEMFKSLQELYVHQEDYKEEIEYLEDGWFQPLVCSIDFARPLLEENKKIAPYLCLSEEKGKIVKVALVEDVEDEPKIEFVRVVSSSWEPEILLPLLSNRCKLGAFKNLPRVLILKIIAHIFENNSRWGKRLGVENIIFPGKFSTL